jgi:8-oxo-dGTP pyrophosphatase MutT (NUDIX family)
VAGSNDDLEFRSAALRELAEETGLALTTAGMATSPPAVGVELFEALNDAGTVLDGEALTLVSRWVTPEEAPSRFDTRFYLTQVEATPPVRIDTNELVDHEWVTPDEALGRNDREVWQMFLPTIAHLRWLRLRASSEEAVAAARGADGRSLIAPRRMDDGSIVPIHLPGDP